jgi:hypothetical protein
MPLKQDGMTEPKPGFRASEIIGVCERWRGKTVCRHSLN